MTISLVQETPPQFELTMLEPFGVRARCKTPDINLQRIAASWLEDLVATHGVVVLRGLSSSLTAAEFEAYCRRIGPLLSWPFGNVLDLKVVENTKNYLFTRDDVQFHWDGVFAKAEPHYLFFQCLQAPVDGGESLYCDTARVWKRLSTEEQQWLRGCVCRYRQELTAHYGGDVKAPVIREHPLTGETTVRYAEPVRGIGGNAPELMKGSGDEVDIEGSHRLAAFMEKVLYEPKVCLQHTWQTGDFLMLDNYRMLHGRKAFGKHSDRHLQRVHIL